MMPKGYRVAEARSRIAWIDALRCLAILMVVAGHSISEVMLYDSPGPGLIEFFGGWIDTIGLNNIPYNLIASVYMPLFAFVSGAASGLKGLRITWPTIGKRAWQLLVPYFAWPIVTALFTWNTVSQDVGGWLHGYAMMAIQPRSSGLWFLYAIFVVQVAVAIVTSVSERPRALVISSLGMTVLMLFLRSDPFGIRDLALLYPFFAMGMLEARYKVLSKPKVLLASVLAYPLTLALVWPTIWEVERWWPGPFSAFLDGLPGMPSIVAGLTAALMLHYARYGAAAAGIVILYNLYLRLPKAALDYQVPVGQRTVGIYAIHYHLVRALVAAGIGSATMVFAVAAAVSFAITLVIERIPVASSLLLGKPWRQKSCTPPDAAPS